VAALILVLRWMRKRAPSSVLNDNRFMYLALVGGIYLSLMLIWPVVTGQTVLPVVPILVVVFVGLLTCSAPGPGQIPPAGQSLLPPNYEDSSDDNWQPSLLIAVVIAAAFIGASSLIHSPVKNRTVEQKKYLTQVLALTRPGEYVMDPKGESVFR